MIRSVNAAHLHSQSRPVSGWLSRLPHPRSPLSLFAASSSSLLILLHTSSGTVLPMLPACERACFWPRLLSQTLPYPWLGLAGNRYPWMGNACCAGCESQVQPHRLLRTTAAFRHMQMRLGFNYGPIPLDML